MKTVEMELALAEFFDSRQNMIVPNISWGLGIHECDLLVVSKKGYCQEIEIKVSVADLKKDQKKEHNHESAIIKWLYFAIPAKLRQCQHLIPERAGIIVVERTRNFKYRCQLLRTAKTNQARPLTEKEIKHVAELGMMRIWTLKAKVLKLQKANKKC